MDDINEILGVIPIRMDDFDPDYLKDPNFNGKSLQNLGDIKNQTPVECSNNKDHKVWLISYAGGKKIHFDNQNYQLYSAVNKCIDFVVDFSPANLEDNFVKENQNILSKSRGAGYWLWKPYIILKTLEAIPKNDILIYVDSGAYIKKPVDDLINNLNDKHDIIFFKNGHDHTRYTKRDLLKMFDMDNEETRKTISLQATFSIIRNNDFSHSFINNWLDWCKKEGAITDSRSQNEYPEFKDHRHDQSILSLLWLQNEKDDLNQNKILALNFEDLNRHFKHHRRRK
jgi:hypothetical protein